MNTHGKYELPPLFLPGAIGKYTKKEMQDYARAAIELYRQGGNAKHQYEKAIEGSEELDPIERLRFFCSIAMRAQDWLDVEPLFEDLVADRQRIAELEAQLEDYKRAVASTDRLVRELDVLINGKEGAAEQASLCDIVCQLEADRQRRGEPVAWHSKQYGTVWMAIKPGNLVSGTQWFIQGRQEPVAEVASPVSLVWHISTSELEHGTVFYTAPQPTEPTQLGYTLSDVHEAYSRGKSEALKEQPAEPTPTQKRHARLRADPVKAAALDRAHERIAVELLNFAEPVKVPSAFAAGAKELSEELHALLVEIADGERKPEKMPIAPLTRAAAMLHQVARYGQPAQPAASAEPVGEAQPFQPAVTSGAFTHCIFESKLVPAGTKLYAGPVADQPQPSGNPGELPQVALPSRPEPACRAAMLAATQPADGQT